jgi:hypothetical protein
VRLKRSAALAQPAGSRFALVTEHLRSVNLNEFIMSLSDVISVCRSGGVAHHLSPRSASRPDHWASFTAGLDAVDKRESLCSAGNRTSAMPRQTCHYRLKPRRTEYSPVMLLLKCIIV